MFYTSTIMIYCLVTSFSHLVKLVIYILFPLTMIQYPTVMIHYTIPIIHWSIPISTVLPVIVRYKCYITYHNAWLFHHSCQLSHHTGPIHQHNNSLSNFSGPVSHHNYQCPLVMIQYPIPLCIGPLFLHNDTILPQCFIVP